MARLAVINGEPFAPEQAKVSVYDRGFLYGDAVFETVRTYGGRLFALDEHLRRLESSSRAIGLELPVPIDAIGREIEQAVARARNAESLVRVTVSRGSGPLGLDPDLALAPLRVVLVEPLELPPASTYRDGIGVVCVQTVRASDAAHSAKLNNYLASVLALREARRQGAHEALVVGRDGFVVEGTTSNIFGVRAAGPGGRSVVYTPPLEAGVLPGITRALVLRLAEQMGLGVRLETMKPSELAQLDELFLTSSVREVMPVVRVDGAIVGRGEPGATTRRLHRALRAAVGLAAQPMPWELG